MATPDGKSRKKKNKKMLNNTVCVVYMLRRPPTRDERQARGTRLPQIFHLYAYKCVRNRPTYTFIHQRKH